MLIALAYRNADNDIDLLQLLTDEIIAGFHRSLETHSRLILEMGYRAQNDRVIDDMLREAMEPIIERVRDEFEVEEHDHPFWGMMVIRERP